MNEIKCQHEWEYFDEHDFPNGYEYEQVNIPHKRCKKCSREYELFDGYGEYVKRWRKVEPWSPELHKLEQELIRTRKALDVAVDAIKNATEYLGNQEPLVDVMAMNLYTDLSKVLEQITALEQKEE
jgi:hypothetical protein